MSDADHSVRSLAEILREHGLESDAGTRPGTTGPVRPKRRRTVEETAAGAGGSTGKGADTGRTGVTGTGAPASGERRVAERRDPRATTPPPPVDAKAPPAKADGGSRFGRRRAPEAAPATVEQPVPGEPAPSTAAIPGMRTGRTPVGTRSGADPVPATGPIPKVVLPQDDRADAEPLSTSQAAVAWARFAGELVVALAVGVGLYYLFTVLWELQPYVAAVAAPLAVTGLVGGVSAWRQRQGQGAVGLRLLLVLLFAGTLLCVVPAAGLLSGS